MIVTNCKFLLLFFFTLSLALPEDSQCKGLNIEEKIGQMLIIGFRGQSLEAVPDLKNDLTKNRVGGVILFDYDMLSKQRGRNIVNPQQLVALISQLKNASEIPLFIMIDQEGGQVARLNEHNGFERGLSAGTFGKSENWLKNLSSIRKIAEQLYQSGVNVNLAPVVDLCINPDNPVINKLERCYSKDPEQTTQMASIFIDAHKNKNILTVLKHFPGHGSSDGDTHEGYVDISSNWSAVELLPFQNLINMNKADMIMVAHVFNSKIDPIFPASLSIDTITNLLIHKMGYQGLIISDDLQMAALTDHFSEKDILYRAIMAGNDLLIYGNNLRYKSDLLNRKIKLINELIHEGKISEARIDKSWQKILRVKNRLH